MTPYHCSIILAWLYLDHSEQSSHLITISLSRREQSLHLLATSHPRTLRCILSFSLLFVKYDDLDLEVICCHCEIVAGAQNNSGDPAPAVKGPVEMRHHATVWGHLPPDMTFYTTPNYNPIYEIWAMETKLCDNPHSIHQLHRLTNYSQGGESSRESPQAERGRP